MKRLLALATTAVTLILPASATGATVGATTVHAPVRSNPTGLAQVYRFTAPSSGRVNRLNVFLDATSTAGKVELGLYRAGTLRARCVVSSPQANAWNGCSTTAYSVRAGAYYWLALLQPYGSTGRMQYREGNVSGGPATYASKNEALASLPSTWKNGAARSDGHQASIYADEVVSSPAPTPTPTPEPSQPPEADFSIAPNPAVRTQLATFTSTGTCPDAPCSYHWFHGDGSTNEQIGAGAIATFTYVGPVGVRTVTLRATDSDDQTDSETKTFDLVEPPPAAAACGDGHDNDGDGLTDYPSDAGCVSTIDNDESNVTDPPSSEMPGPDNTGVRPGTVLVPSGGLTINTEGAVVEGREITGQVVVNAPNVTIRNSRIRSNAMWVIDNNSTGLVVEDSEILNRPVAGQPNCHNAIGNANLTVRRTELTGCENAMNVDAPGNVTFVDNYVHDLDTEGPSHVWGCCPHTDGIQVGNAAANLVIRHNWIDPSPASGITAPIILYTPTSGTPNSRVWIEDNYLDARGASYAIYAPREQTSDVYINRNRMWKGYGYTGCVRLGVTVTAFDDNRDAGTNALILPDNGAGGGCSN